MASLLDLAGAAEAVLAGFTEQLAPLITLPERAYVAPGSLIPWDGEQFVVNLLSLDAGQPGGMVGTTVDPRAGVFSAQFGIGIVRVVPALSGDGEAGVLIPDAAELDLAGQAGMTDAAALLQAAINIHLAIMETGRYPRIAGPGDGFVVGQTATFGPDGGLAAVRVTVSVSLT